MLLSTYRRGLVSVFSKQEVTKAVSQVYNNVRKPTMFISPFKLFEIIFQVTSLNEEANA